MATLTDKEKKGRVAPHTFDSPQSAAAALAGMQATARAQMAAQGAPAVSPSPTPTGPTWTSDLVDSTRADAGKAWREGGAGGVGRAIGIGLRGAALSVPAGLYDAGDAVVSGPIGRGVGGFVSGLLGGPGDAAQPPAVAVQASTQNPAPAKDSASVQVQDQPVADMPAATPGTQGLSGLDNYRANDIKKTVDANGNVTYSGSNIGPGATINGQEAGGGYMEVPGARGLASLAQPAASQAPSIQTPTIRHSGNDWQARNDLRSAQIAASTLRSDWDRYRDGEIDNRGRATGKGGNAAQAAYQAALQADNEARGQASKAPLEAARLNAGLSQEAMRQDGQSQREGARLGLAALGAQDALATSALARERAGVELEGIRQDAALRRTLTDPNATPEQRKQAQEALLAMRGKQEQPNRFTVVPGGQEWDQQAGQMRNVPARVLDNQTGQFVQGGQGQGATPPPLDKNPAALAIQQDASLSREQQLEKLKALGYANI